MQHRQLTHIERMNVGIVLYQSIDGVQVRRVRGVVQRSPAFVLRRLVHPLDDVVFVHELVVACEVDQELDFAGA